MANQEQLNNLQQGVGVWNAWRSQQPEIPIDLGGANLIKTDLRFVDFRGIDLGLANLRGADLVRADLNRANLAEANLSFADLRGANLVRTDLRGTNFSHACIGLTTFGDVDLSTAKGLETIAHQFPSTIGIDTLYRSHGKIPEVFLRRAGVPESFIEVMVALTNYPIDYYTCFMSYSNKDELFAKRLHNDLQLEGVRCWFAPEDMDIGDKIKHRIDTSIRLYDKLLLILSEHSIASSWVAYEVERALNKEPQGMPNVLYPVRIDQAILTCTTDWARDIKETRHIGDFEQWTDLEKYQSSFQRLLRALRGKPEPGKS